MSKSKHQKQQYLFLISSKCVMVSKFNIYTVHLKCFGSIRYPLCPRHTVPKWLRDGYTKSKMQNSVLYRTITVYHRVISLLAPCISGHFLGLRVCISWWENILWYAKEFVKITTELHLRVISLLPRCSSWRLRAPPWWQHVCSVQTFFPTFPQFFPLFTTFHHFSPLFTTFSPLFTTFRHFFQLFPTFRLFPPLLAT